MAVSDQPIERESLEQLLRRLRPRLKQVLGRYRIPAHDAEDLVQEALISTIQKWEVIQDPEAWLLVTLRNRCEASGSWMTSHFWMVEMRASCTRSEDHTSQL